MGRGFPQKKGSKQSKKNTKPDTQKPAGPLAMRRKEKRGQNQMNNVN